MFKKWTVRISVVVTIVIAVSALALAISTGTSEAQGPVNSGNSGQSGYRNNDGQQGVPLEDCGLGINPANGFNNQSMLDAVAEALGMTSEDVSALRQTGLTYAEIAAQQGVDLEALIDQLALQHEATLQQQYNAGTLSADQVEWMQAEMRENIRARLTNLWEAGPGVGYYNGFQCAG